MILRDFHISDLERNENFQAMNFRHKNVLIENLRDNTAAWTLEHNNEIIGSAGFVMYWPGVAEGWAIITDLIFKYPYTAHKLFKKMIAGIEKQYEIHRLQTLCLENFERSQRWLERLGFKYEGKMEKFGPNGETYLRYARVK